MNESDDWFAGSDAGVRSPAHVQRHPLERLERLRGARRDVGRLLQDRLSPKDMDMLRAAGELAHRLGYAAYVVGGFVRDLLLGIDHLDVDVVIEGDGITFARLFAKDTRGSVTVHDRFGTAVVRFADGFTLDVATARTEHYEYPAALPTVAPSSIENDLYRRDFTINTLAVSLAPRTFGRLIDLYGGQRDLKAGVIRVLHRLSFIEDPTRVFRAIRFESRFNFHLSEDTLVLIESAASMELFHRLSGERLLNELRRLFLGSRPHHAVRRLADLDLLRCIHPKLVWSSRLNRRVREVEEALEWYRNSGVDRSINRWLIYFMVLAEVLSEQAVRELLERFPFTEAERSTITEARFTARDVFQRLSHRVRRPSEVVRLLAGLSDETLLFLLAKGKPESAKRQIVAYLTAYRTVRPVLTGKELKALHLSPGPLYGKILTKLTEARLNGDVTSEAEERALVKRLIKNTADVRENCACRSLFSRRDH